MSDESSVEFSSLIVRLIRAEGPAEKLKVLETFWDAHAEWIRQDEERLGWFQKKLQEYAGEKIPPDHMTHPKTHFERQTEKGFGESWYYDQCAAPHCAAMRRGRKPVPPNLWYFCTEHRARVEKSE